MISSMLVLPGFHSGHSCAKRREVPRSQGRDVLSAEAPGRNFQRVLCAGNLLLETQTRRAFAVANEAEHRSAAGRGSSTERVTEGEQGKNWRNGARAEISADWGDCKTHCRKPPTIQFSVSPPSRATTDQRVQCTHTKPHSICGPPRDRARHRRPRRWYIAASIRCRHGKQLRNKPHGEVRHR